MNDKVKAFFSQKGFYISLLVGVIAILAVGIISANVFTGKNETAPKVADNEPQASLVETVPQSSISVAENPVVETPVVKVPLTEPAPHVVAETQTADTQEVADAAKVAEVEPETAPVVSQSERIANLNFDEEKGLLWPITGEVILPFSMDKSIYFKTLAQYKCNSAMVIAGTEDMEVGAAYDGVITAIKENEETGLTVTMSIGDGYEVVYGNLKNVTGEVGDFVKEGDTIGKLAQPTKYYVEEGTNLFFQVLENEEVVDPMLVLR